jgi:hypothetical protein
MSPLSEVQALYAKRDALEAQLSMPNIDQDERMAIRRQIIAFSREIRASNIVAPRPPPSLMVRLSDCLYADPLGSIQTGLAVGAIGFSVWLSAVASYMPWRHRVAPYTQKQINRRHILGFQLKYSTIPPGAKKAFTSGMLLLLLGWI